MAGLLWSWARNHAPESPQRTRLMTHDLRSQAHLVRVRTLLESCAEQLGSEGIEVTSIKGPTTESRWYERAGERPCSDVDLWLSPHQIDRAGDAIRLLQPDHPWVPFFGELAARREVQTVTTRVDGLEVDLHLDLFKTGLRTRDSERVWSRTELVKLQGGGSVRVLDPATAYVHFLIHLNKDRFQRLLGYADIVRIARDEAAALDARAVAIEQGLTVCSDRSARVVQSDLGCSLAPDLRTTAGWRHHVWSALWGERIRLRGREGRERFRRRQLALVLLAERSAARDRWEALLRELLPPQQVLRAQGRPTGARRLAELLTSIG